MTEKIQGPEKPSLSAVKPLGCGTDPLTGEAEADVQGHKRKHWMSCNPRLFGDCKIGGYMEIPYWVLACFSLRHGRPADKGMSAAVVVKEHEAT